MNSLSLNRICIVHLNLAIQSRSLGGGTGGEVIRPDCILLFWGPGLGQPAVSKGPFPWDLVGTSRKNEVDCLWAVKCCWVSVCVLKLLVSGHKGHPAGRIPRQLSGKVLFEARESRKGPADAGFPGKIAIETACLCVDTLPVGFGWSTYILRCCWLIYSKAIYALSLSNSTSTEFYRVNHIIDGLTLHNGKLYWTDASNGLIASLDISSPQQHQVLKTRLDKPRAIVVTDRCASHSRYSAAGKVCDVIAVHLYYAECPNRLPCKQQKHLQ